MSIRTTQHYLGYKVADDLKVFRTRRGIVFNSKKPYKLLPLINHPVTVRISKIARERIKNEVNQFNNYSSINIKAKLNTGKTVVLFTINLNFFSRVNWDRNTTQAYRDYEVPPFNYNPKDQSLSDYFDCQRTIGAMFENKNNQIIKQNDYVTSFQATYMLGMIVARETHTFVPRFFDWDEFPEKLLLQIDFTNGKNWNLSVCQRK